MPTPNDAYVTQSTKTGSVWGVEDTSRTGANNVRFKHPTGGWWNTEQSYTAVCPEGLTGPSVTKTVPARTIFSAYSQRDANQRALAEAQTAAQAALSCQLLHFNERQQVLLICPAGQVGDSYVSVVEAGTVGSVISVEDANQQAFNLAVTQGEASIVCVIEPPGVCGPVTGISYQDSLGPELECLVL